MKKFTLLIAFLIGTIFTQSQNLILNGSAELPMVNGEIPHWTKTIGNSWVAINNLALFNFEVNSVPNGDFWFWAGNNVKNVDGFNVSELEQIIDVSSDAANIDQGIKNYFFSGFTRSFEQGLNDESNIFIEFLDVNNVLITAFNFGPFSTASSWINVKGTMLAPINARKIRVKLHTILRNGSDNDGCYDDLYLGSTPLLEVSKNAIETSDILIYPNPSNGIFNIQTDRTIENAVITVSDLNGRMLYQSKTEKIEIKQLDLSHFQAGIYLLNIKKGSFNYIQKIIKE